MECDVCKEIKDVFKCDGCNQSICKSCGKLTSSEVKVLQLNNRVLRFYCSKCKKNETYSLFHKIIECKDQLIENKERSIADKDAIIGTKEELCRMLKKEIEDLQSARKYENNRIGYNEAVKKSTPEVLVVKPKKTQESSKTRQIIEEKVDPSSLGVGVARVKYVRDGGVAISCNKQEDVRNISG